MIAFSFGERLKHLGKHRRLSQEEMGRRIGRSKPVISSYENNLKVPSLDILTNTWSASTKKHDSIEAISESQKRLSI